MKAKYEMIDVDGEKYPIAYNMVVSRDLQEEFGSLSKWGEIFETVERDEDGNLIEDKKNGVQVYSEKSVLKNEDGSIFLAKQKEIRISDMIRTFAILLNEGIRQYNKEAISKMSKLDNDDVAELLGYINGGEIIRNIVAKSNPESNDDGGEKNVQTEQNQ